MNEIQIQLSFLPKTFSGADFTSLLSHEKFLGFKPEKINSYVLEIDQEKFNQKEHFNKINQLDSTNAQFSIASKKIDGPSFNTLYPGHKSPPQLLNWFLSEEQFKQVVIPLELLTSPQFVTGLIFNFDFVLWETETMINNYNYFNKSHNHLKKYFDPIQKMEMIDISRNAGRITLVSNMFLEACREMYFGKQFFKNVPKERLLAFKGAKLIKEYSPDFVHVALYGSEQEKFLETKIALLQKFREWIDMDKLEASLK